MIVAVADTGPLIHLDEIDALHLLSVVDELLIPQTVYEELKTGTVPSALSTIEYEFVEAERTERTADLDPGETAALAVASERSAVLLTDDLAARDAAKDIDVEVHGSIGIIVLGYTRGELTKSKAAELMRALQTETSLFIMAARRKPATLGTGGSRQLGHNPRLMAGRLSTTIQAIINTRFYT